MVDLQHLARGGAILVHQLKHLGLCVRGECAQGGRRLSSSREQSRAALHACGAHLPAPRHTHPAHPTAPHTCTPAPSRRPSTTPSHTGEPSRSFLRGGSRMAQGPPPPSSLARLLGHLLLLRGAPPVAGALGGRHTAHARTLAWPGGANPALSRLRATLRGARVQRPNPQTPPRTRGRALLAAHVASWRERVGGGGARCAAACACLSLRLHVSTSCVEGRRSSAQPQPQVTRRLTTPPHTARISGCHQAAHSKQVGGPRRAGSQGSYCTAQP